jgi:hypothetical protein
MSYGNTQVFKDKHKILGGCDSYRIEGSVKWGEEEGKSSVFLRRSCLNSSLVPNVVRKLFALKYTVMMAELPWVAEAVVSKTSFL